MRGASNPHVVDADDDVAGTNTHRAPLRIVADMNDFGSLAGDTDNQTSMNRQVAERHGSKLNGPNVVQTDSGATALRHGGTQCGSHDDDKRDG